MSTRSENIRFNVYLNDRQAGNTMGNLYKQSRMLKSELRKLKIGSQEWIDKMKELKKVERSLTRVRSEMRNTNSALSRMAGAFNKYFTMITAGVAGVVAAVYSLRKSTQVFSDFEKSMANVMTLLSDAEKIKYRDFLKKGSIQLMRDYGFAIQDTNKALFDAISAGVEAGKSIQFMNTASKLAIGGVTDLHTSVDGLTTVINAYKLKTEDAAKVSDAFFSAQKEGKTTVAELSANIGKAAPLAHSLGISYQELLSATAALTKGGIDTESAFTYLRGVFSSMIKPSKELTKLFKTEFGHALSASEVKAIGFTKVMQEMNVLMQKYPDQLQASVQNVRALTAVTALSGKGLEEYQEILEKVNTDIGEHSSLAKAFAEQEKTLSQHLEEAKGNLIAMTISLVEGFRPAIIGATKLVSKFSHLMLKFGLWMKEHAQTVKFYAKALATVITSIATYKMVLAAANAKVNIAIKLTGLMQNIALRSAIAYNKLTGNIGRAAAAQRVLNTTVKANPLGLILSAITMAITAYNLFKTTVKETTEAQVKLNKAIKEGQDIMTNSQPIEQRFKVVKKLSKSQLKNLKDDINEELALISKKEAKILTIYTASNKWQVKELQDLHKKLEHETDAHQREILKQQIYWKTKELDELIKKEQGISATELEQKKRAYEKMNRVIAEEMKKKPQTTGSGSNTVNSSATTEEIKKLEELNEEIKKLAHQQELAKMDANSREIQLVKDKYAKLIAQAKGHNEQIKRLEELRDAEINRIKAQHDAEYLAKKKEVQKKIDQMGYSDEQKELAANKETFDKLIALAKQYGIDATALIEQEKKNEQAIRDKYNQQEVEANRRKNQKIKQDNMQAAQATLNVMGNIVSGAMQYTDQQSEAYKELALFQTAINTAAAAMAAYNSVVGTPIIGPVLAPIAAAAAVAFGFLQMTKIANTDYGKVSPNSYGKGGVVQGASHDEGGIALVDSKTGRKVGEMEGGEPYMILSKETYKNNKALIDALLNSSMHHNGEPVQYLNPGYYPQPDLAATMGKMINTKYATGGVTQVNNHYSNIQNIQSPDMQYLFVLLKKIIEEIKNSKDKKIVVDIDGVLQLRDAINQIENIEKTAAG